MAADGDNSQLLTLTTQIVSAYVGRQPIPQQDLRTTIRLVHETLSSLRRKGEAASVESESRIPTRPPAVPVARSITPDYLICLEDGRRLKTLKRHLRAAYGLSPRPIARAGGCPGLPDGRAQLRDATQLDRQAAGARPQADAHARLNPAIDNPAIDATWIASGRHIPAIKLRPQQARLMAGGASWPILQRRDKSGTATRNSPRRRRVNGTARDMSRLEELCQKKGLKMTGQRRVIARVLSNSTDHPDVGSRSIAAPRR